ncbi:MAG TPA: hypothetical protein VFX89_21410 [Gammaproteobacteria bacterium]|nr:hypothetical protein [Gammaproteobacteria bacterium]
MIGRVNLLRGLMALWCLGAASCAGIDDRPPEQAAAAAETVQAKSAAAEPQSATVVTQSAAAKTEAAVPAPESAGRESSQSAVSAEPAQAAPAQSELSASAPAVPRTTADSPVVVAAPSPVDEESVSASFSSASPAPTDTLDFAALVTRLRRTKALNLLTKVAVKNQSNDLLEEFRAYHTRHGTATLGELRRSYDLLFAKLHSLLEDADPPLARDIDRSQAAIWDILADPRKFTASRLL